LLVAGHALTWRLPDSTDLVAAAEAPDPLAAEEALLSRIVEPAGPLSTVERAAVVERIAACDPYAELLFELTCPECGLVWQSLLDIAGFLWAELDTRAQRLLREVHALASAYGWTQAEILALTERRRAGYLRLVRDE
jgi:hypothetical protein